MYFQSESLYVTYVGWRLKGCQSFQWAGTWTRLFLPTSALWEHEGVFNLVQQTERCENILILWLNHQEQSWVLSSIDFLLLLSFWFSCHVIQCPCPVQVPQTTLLSEFYPSLYFQSICSMDIIPPKFYNGVLLVIYLWLLSSINQSL